MVLPAHAQNAVPDAFLQEMLIKTSLLTLNDANLTGNYTVLHAKGAKPFREQFSPDRLKQNFQSFVDKKVDWSVIAAKQPITTSESKIDNRGALLLRGYFDTKPRRLIYELDFLSSKGKWKPIRLYVNVTSPLHRAQSLPRKRCPMSQPPVSQPKAVSTWRKIFAAILDFVFVLLIAGYTIAYFTGNTTEYGFRLKGAPAFILFAIIILYFVIFTRYLGGTMWQRLLGVR